MTFTVIPITFSWLEFNIAETRSFGGESFMSVFFSILSGATQRAGRTVSKPVLWNWCANIDIASISSAAYQSHTALCLEISYTANGKYGRGTFVQSTIQQVLHPKFYCLVVNLLLKSSLHISVLLAPLQRFLWYTNVYFKTAFKIFKRLLDWSWTEALKQTGPNLLAIKADETIKSCVLLKLWIFPPPTDHICSRCYKRFHQAQALLLRTRSQSSSRDFINCDRS